MIVLLSPAKTLDFTSQINLADYSIPTCLKEAEYLVTELKRLSAEQISKLMAISPALAKLNFERFQAFTVPFNKENARQAILAYKGDVYTNIKVDSFSTEDFAFAQKHLRIISGLYGIVRPLDLLQPYRLEMQVNLVTEKGKNLYEFWDDRLTDTINQDMAASKNRVIINLASQEYFAAIHRSKLNGQLINITFKEFKNNKYQIIGLLAKRARGMMANFIIKNKITNSNQLQEFSEAGYHLQQDLSSDAEMVFVR